MSQTNQPTFVDTNHPVYYGEVLNRTCRLENRRPDELFSTRDVDNPYARRLQTLLDVIADISLCQRGNVCATMASLKEDNGTLETRLYIIFNHDRDEAALRCTQHLQSVFSMLRQVPYAAMGLSSKIIPNDLEENLVEISRAIHNYSFDIFAHRVTKREHKLSEIREFIEQDRTRLQPEHRSELVDFLQHMNMIIKTVARAQAKKQFSTTQIKMLVCMYRYWTQHNLLARGGSSHKKATLLDIVDTWLAEDHPVGFQLGRWALKTMSFVISSLKLFTLIQSCRLRRLVEGTFIPLVLPSPTTTPYRCTLSSESVQAALEASLAGTRYLTANWDEDRRSFITWLSEEPEVTRWNPTVHAELAMIMAMDKGRIGDVLPHIGVSKPSCIMCTHYICALWEVTGEKIVTKGSQGKAYPGWFWPTHFDRDGEIHQVFLKACRQQLCADFKHYSEQLLQNSDSSVRSDSPIFDWNVTMDDIIRLRDKGLAEKRGDL